jgi:hypothetical protein
MNLSVQDARSLQKYAVFAVAANVIVALVLWLALPAHAVALLPIVALMLPFITTGVLDAVAHRMQRSSSRSRPSQAGRRPRASFQLRAT